MSREGKVKSWNHHTWGFIETEEGDIFCHASMIGDVELIPGEAVTFNIGESRGKDCAVNVTGPGTKPKVRRHSPRRDGPGPREGPRYQNRDNREGPLRGPRDFDRRDDRDRAPREFQKSDFNKDPPRDRDYNRRDTREFNRDKNYDRRDAEPTHSMNVVPGKLYEGTVVSWNRGSGFISTRSLTDLVSVEFECIRERGDDLEVHQPITFTCRLENGKPIAIDAFGPAIISRGGRGGGGGGYRDDHPVDRRDNRREERREERHPRQKNVREGYKPPNIGL